MRPYLSSSVMHGRLVSHGLQGRQQGKGALSAAPTQRAQQEADADPCLYELYTVVCHRGNLQVRAAALQSCNGAWHRPEALLAHECRHAWTLSMFTVLIAQQLFTSSSLYCGSASCHVCLGMCWRSAEDGGAVQVLTLGMCGAGRALCVVREVPGRLVPLR